jgi:1-acyl-sn-glycerol-3-phosphate acyltransferase
MRLRYDIDSLENRDPELIDRAYRLVARPLERYFRSQVRGLERIPPGAGLFVGNHSSAMLTPDSFIFGAALYRRFGIRECPFGLGHEIAIRLPIVHQIIMPLGAVRASHENAHRLFERGHKVLVYPGGDVDALRPFRDRNRVVFGGRRGYIRLALRERVPLIPVVSAGAHATLIILDDLRPLAERLWLTRLLRVKAWPLTLSVPWGLTVGPPIVYLPLPVRIWIEVLEPIRFERDGEGAAADEDYLAECATRVEATMQAALEQLDRERRAAG